MEIEPGKYQNVKTGKVVIVSRVSATAWHNRDCDNGPERHVYFNGTRDGKRFGKTHSSPLSKFIAAYQPDERDTPWIGGEN